MSDHEHADDRPSLRRRLSRRILGDEEAKGLLSEAREAAAEAVEGVKARPELVRLIAREVRSYLDELGLKDDVHSLLTNYSLEVRASINLRRLAGDEKGGERGDEKTEKPAEKAEKS